MTEDEIKKLLHKRKIEKNFLYIKNNLNNIILYSETLSTGNVSHHRNSIKRKAEDTKKRIEFIKKEYEDNK